MNLQLMYCKDCRILCLENSLMGTQAKWDNKQAVKSNIDDIIISKRWDAMSLEKQKETLAYFFPKPKCWACSSFNIVRWNSLNAQLKEGCPVSIGYQHIIGSAENLFAMRTQIGKSPNVIGLLSNIKKQYYVDTGPCRIIKYNKLAGIETLLGPF